MTEFPKHYDHKEVEPKIQKFWQDEGVYQFDAPSRSKEVFSVDTPPPYVSSDHLHVGHAMSYSQAEFVVRYQRMLGKKIFYPMGFDDNGLPTERFVEKKHKINKGKINRKEFVKLCLEETAKGAETYRKLWRSLGISVDWKFSYSTIDPHCQKTAQSSFLELIETGNITRLNEPIIWCYKCQTSLAQADVETQELPSELHDIAFKDEEAGELVISTTRPELIPACVALYVNPEDERYRHLHGKNAIVPLMDQKVPIKTDESVEKEFGTGLMMVCTWGDMEDVRKWKEHQLDTRLIFHANGQLNDQAGPIAGEYFTKARKTIVALLKEKGLHQKSVSVQHNVGVHERCETPIDFNIAPQWFIRTLPLKEELLQRGDELDWHPPFMKIRYEQWVRDLKWDWNISRQRYYGVPFPVWYCKECQTPVFAKKDQLPVDPTLDSPPEENCPKCKSTEFIPENDVMDTWMTSSLTPLINAQWANNTTESKKLFEEIYPMSLRPQAFEIIRTWLFYTVLKSHLHTKSLPWKHVMISGWGLDPKGRKISKRLGNFVDANTVIDQYSADALRFWSAGSTLGHDLRYNEKDVAAGRKIVVKLWNALKFVSSNLKACDLTAVEGKEMTQPPSMLIDHWVLSHLQKTVQKASRFFDEFEYSHALRAIEKFFWITYCDNYLEIVKDRFWNPESYDKESLLSAQQTLYVTTRTVLKLFAPILPHITEELWQRFFRSREDETSIHRSAWPKAHESLIDEKAIAGGDLLLTCLFPVRKFKSKEKVHQNHALQEITIRTTSQNEYDQIQIILKDIASATRAQNVQLLSEPATADALKTENENIFVSILK